MPIPRVDISSEIQDWREAVYGEEVRSANVSALQKLQTQMNAACDGIEQVESDATDTLAQAMSASQTANAASQTANNAITQAQTAITQASGYADAAEASANQAAGKVTDCAAYARDAQTALTDAQAAKTAAERARDEAREAIPEDYEEVLKIVSNDNLLHNPFFTVNQRGFSSGTGGWCSDRWHNADTCTASVISNGLHLKRTASGTTIYQNIEMSRFDTSKTVTLSFNTSLGMLTVTSAISESSFNAYGTAVSGVCARLYKGSSDTYLRCILEVTGSSAEFDVYSAKLEYGTISTLANDSAPDYDTELLKCQRYFQRINNSGFFGYIAATTVIGFNPVFTVPMRSTPSLTSLSADGTSNRAFAFAQTTAGNKAFGTATQTLSVSAGSNTSPIVSLTLGTAMSGVTASTPCYIRLTGNIDFSADL